MKDNGEAEKYRKRIAQLLEKLSNVKRLAETHDMATIDGCFAGTLSVVEALYGASSPQAKALMESRKAYKALYEHEVLSLGNSLRGILLNVLEEIDQGLIRKISVEAAGEVIGDMVALAKLELKAGYKDVASVLAAAALEDALKRKAVELGINVEGKALDAIVNALKGQSFFKGAQAPIVSSYVKFRNSAMHAEWDKIQDSDVSSVLGFLEPFLL